MLHEMLHYRSMAVASLHREGIPETGLSKCHPYL